MKSPPHRRNLLDGRFEHVGIAVVHGRPGRAGDGSAATYTVNFGYKS